MLILRGHSGPVLGVAFAPDGASIASASADSTVRGWTVPGGKELFRHTTSRSRATAVAFSPDGAGLAAAFFGPGALVQWYRPAIAARAGQSRGLDQTCRCLAFSPDSSTLYMAAGEDLLATDFTGSTVGRSHRHGVDLGAIAVRPDGEVVGVGLGSMDVLGFLPDLSGRRVFTRGPLVPISSDPFAAQELRGLSISPDGSRLAFGVENYVAVYDGPPAKTPRVWPAHVGEIFTTAFADERTVLTAGTDGVVKCWHVDYGSERTSFDFGIGDIYSLAVAPDGLTAAAAGLQGIVLWDLDP